MKKIMYSFAAALVLSGFVASAQAVPVTVDFSTDLAGFVAGTQVTKIPGMSFVLTDSNNVVVGSPIYDGYAGLYDQLTSGGPVIENMIFMFASPANNVHFDYAGGGQRGVGNMGFQAWDANGSQVASGALIGLDSWTLPDGTAKIQFYSREWINYLTQEPMPALPLNISSLHADLNIAAVPEPETIGMLLGGLALLGALQRKKAISKKMNVDANILAT